MKKALFLAVALLTAISLYAADVDAAAARVKALNFLNGQVAQGKMKTSVANLKLMHTEMNSANSARPVYYIFNSTDGFVIVSGDDRAKEILAYGDAPADVNNVPDNVQYWLDCYKEELEYLQSHPGLVVEESKPSPRLTQGGDVQPMITAMWDQLMPYNVFCPYYENVQCPTGCAATAVAQVFYYWKYPNDSTPYLSPYFTRSLNIFVDDWYPQVFDFDNMLDVYDIHTCTGDQANAVATLMRCIGQAEQMNYGPDQSGASIYDVERAVLLLGYDQKTVKIMEKTPYDGSQEMSDENWIALMLDELYNDRPIVYMGFSYDYESGQHSGHCFNVDGYDATNNMFNINWGWGGDYNGHFAFKAFQCGSYSYNLNQQMLIGLRPTINVPEEDHMLGDVNHDQIEDIRDVALLIDYLLGQNVDICTVCGDVTGDGFVTIEDVASLIDLLLEL